MTRSIVRIASALALVSSPWLPLGAQEQPGSYAITNARIVTVSGDVISGGTVLFARGIITAVGRNVRVPAGTWTIDGSGKTVYPGLINGLSTVGMPAPPRPARPQGGPGGPPGGGTEGGGDPNQAPYSTGTESRPATFTWVSAADEFSPDSNTFDQWHSAGFTTIVTAPSRGFFSGHAAVVNLRDGRPNGLVLKAQAGLRFNMQGGAGHRGYPSSPPGVFSYLKQSFLDAQHYANAWARYESDPRGLERPEYDRALEGMTSAGAGEEPLLFPAGTATEIRRAISTASALGARPILYGAAYGYQVAGEIAASRFPVLVGLDWPVAPREGDPEADEALDVMRHRLLSPTTPARLAEAGVAFAFHTDGVRDASAVLPAIRRAVAAGLSPDQAIRALTLSAAEMYGVADRLGSVETGKIANLTVTNGDLFANGTTVAMVFVDGEMYEVKPAQPEASGGRNGQGARPGQAEEADPVDESEIRGLIGESFRGPYRDDAVTVIRNATVLTVTNGTIENGSVLLRNGTIAAVGRDVVVPPGAHVIDATGQFVMPGIIDAHSHVSGGFNEGSVSVSAMTAVLDNLNPDDINMYRALAGGVTTINVLHGSSNPIGGQNAVVKLRWGSSAEEIVMEGAPPGIKFALGENPKRDRTPDRYPATRMGVMDVIRQSFVDAQEYQAEWNRFNAANNANAIPPRRDLKLDALAEILRGERLVHAHSYRADEILQLIRLAEEFGFRIATFQHVLEGYKVAKEIAAHGAGASTFSDWWSYKMEAYDAIPYNAAIMVEKGVSVSINSDSDEEMRHLNEEAAKTMHWGGLSETEALSLITINPARQLGVGDRIGSIEVGKDADVTIFDRHPLDNFAVVQQTFVDGKLYFDIDGDRERQRAIDAEKAALKAAKKTTPRITTQAGEGRGP